MKALPVSVSGKTRSIRSRTTDGVGFVNGLHIFRFRVAVINNATARLNIQVLIFHDGGAQRDSHVHVPACAEIPDTTTIHTAFFRLQLINDFHRAHFGGAGHGACGHPGKKRI